MKKQSTFSSDLTLSNQDPTIIELIVDFLDHLMEKKWQKINHINAIMNRTV